MSSSVAEPTVTTQVVPTSHLVTFEDLGTFKTPSDYDHNVCLRRFFEKHPRAFMWKDGSISDRNFTGPSHRLLRDSEFSVRLAIPKKPILFSDCLLLLRNERAVFTGVQGLVSVWEQLNETMERPRKILSLDELNRLPRHLAVEPGEDLRSVPTLGVYVGENDLTLLTSRTPINQSCALLCMVPIS